MRETGSKGDLSQAERETIGLTRLIMVAAAFPEILESVVQGLRSNQAALECHARDEASSDLPVPGLPYSSKPFAGATLLPE